MKKYCDFFQTLHDEQGPIGRLGQGAHYSVLRAMVFHDARGRVLPLAQYADFAVIWDEDHDDRVMEPIQKIFQHGLLPRFLMFGERKGIFTAVADESDEAVIAELQSSISQFTTRLDNGDSWSARVTTLEDGDIINDETSKVTLYLKAIRMLWQLGSKAPSLEQIPFQLAMFKRINDLPMSVRLANCLSSEGIAYVADLVQMSEYELLRIPNFGRHSLNETKELLAGMGLQLGMAVPGWPPKNLEYLASQIGLTDDEESVHRLMRPASGP